MLCPDRPPRNVLHELSPNIIGTFLLPQSSFLFFISQPSVVRFSLSPFASRHEYIISVYYSLHIRVLYYASSSTCIVTSILASPRVVYREVLDPSTSYTKTINQRKTFIRNGRNETNARSYLGTRHTHIVIAKIHSLSATLLLFYIYDEAAYDGFCEVTLAPIRIRNR